MSDGLSAPLNAPPGLATPIGIVAGAESGVFIGHLIIIFSAAGALSGIFVYNPTPGPGNLIVSIAAAAGTDPYGNSYPEGINAPALNLSNQSVTPAAVPGSSTFYSDVNGRPRYISQVGVNSMLDRSTVNVSQFTVGNTTTKSICSASMPYVANESNQSSTFELEATGVGTVGTATVQNILFALEIDGSALGGGSAITVDLTGLSAGQSIAWNLQYRISFLGTGTGATVVVTVLGNISRAGTSVANNAEISFTGASTGTAVDSTVNHTFQPVASFANTAAGQGLTCYTTRLTRRD